MPVYNGLYPETPPRMRGRPSRVGSALSCLGNTPAYAGKTATLSAYVPGGEKHPRVCGEDHTKTERHKYRTETPPRMRGRLLSKLLTLTI